MKHTRKKPSVFKRLTHVTVRAVSSAVASLTGLFNSAYPSIDSTRKEVFNTWRPRYGTANQTIAPNLTTLSAQCRHLERSTPMGRAVAEGLTADVVGNGIDILPNTGNAKLDVKILDAWHKWVEKACIDESSLWDWQAIAMREMVTSGAALARLVILPDRAKQGRIPLAILPLEIEWLSEYQVGPVRPGNKFVRGIEVDAYGRPQRYHLRNPESPIGEKGEIVSASLILHPFEKRRAQQIHGEPILAPVVERTLQDSRLIETELKAAVATAAPAVAIITEAGFGDDDEEDDDSAPVTDIPAGATVRMYPGEKVETIENRRPSQQIAPFRNTIRGDIAGACRVSQYWLDRDASRANYSSMRMDQLLTKRSAISLKRALGKGAASKVYEAAFDWILLTLGEPRPAGATREKMLNHYLRPDQPEYVDPTKDVKASVDAIENNLSTYDIELSSRGKDFRQVFAQRQIENAMLDEMNLNRPSTKKTETANNAKSTEVQTEESVAENVESTREGVA